MVLEIIVDWQTNCALMNVNDKSRCGSRQRQVAFFVFQARNFMRDQMRIGQQAFFYHSNCKEPGIAGVIKVFDFFNI